MEKQEAYLAKHKRVEDHGVQENCGALPLQPQDSLSLILQDGQDHQLVHGLANDIAPHHHRDEIPVPTHGSFRH